MLHDLKHCFRKNNSSLEKFGFPTPDSVPTELEVEQAQWINEQRQNEQKQLLQHMNECQPNNKEQQIAFDAIIESVLKLKTSTRDSLSSHEFHFNKRTWWHWKICSIQKNYMQHVGQMEF